MPPPLLVDPVTFDFTQVELDREAIEKINPQRFEMLQLDAIVSIDRESRTIVGYKDIRPDEFWVRGHMPGYPLMPGVVMCEAAAQICSVFTFGENLLSLDFVGFGGMENVRFRGPVHIGDRFVLVAKAVKLHRRQTIFNVQGFVDTTMVFQADIIGVPMSRKGFQKDEG